MGIENLHILINPDAKINSGYRSPATQQALALQAYQQALVEEHRQGEHPWGQMIKACPLCQAS